jgi:UDP-N-acetylmuramoyl-L-alanyl-D-glutamate--2,6-diaminopimelate ligase
MELRHINDQKNIIKLPEVWPISCHTDNVGNGSIFVAIKGMHYDGVSFIPDAIKKGATTIVIEQDVKLSSEVDKLIKEFDCKVIIVQNTRKSLAELSAQIHNYPAKKLKIIGVTGTKGKTTTSHVIYSILRTAGKNVALISSVENRINDIVFKAPLTTPQPDYLHMFLDLCVQHDVTYVVMEVAAQAFTMHRVDGIFFDVGVFTNFSHEHLEFYATLDNYFKAKAQLLDHLKHDGLLILNGDDAHCLLLIDKHQKQIIFKLSDISDIVVTPSISFSYENRNICAPNLIGLFNVSNILAAIHVAQFMNISLSVISESLQTFTGVKGRLQKHLLANGAFCYIDYAHTPNSYEQLLSLLRQLTHKLIVVFGCGGGKDRLKRPKMGAIASYYADHIVLTADNPRFEKLADINASIMMGIDHKYKVYIEDDRSRAIEYAYKLSEKGAIIALLGKGPDEFQIIEHSKNFFSDTQIINSFCYEGLS